MYLVQFDSAGSCMWELHMSRWENIVARGKFCAGRIWLNRELQFDWLFSSHPVVYKVNLSSVSSFLCIHWVHSQEREYLIDMKTIWIWSMWSYWAAPNTRRQEIPAYGQLSLSQSLWRCNSEAVQKKSSLEDFFLLRLLVLKFIAMI